MIDEVRVRRPRKDDIEQAENTLRQFEQATRNVALFTEMSRLLMVESPEDKRELITDVPKDGVFSGDFWGLSVNIRHGSALYPAASKELNRRLENEVRKLLPELARKVFKEVTDAADASRRIIPLALRAMEQEERAERERQNKRGGGVE